MRKESKLYTTKIQLNTKQGSNEGTEQKIYKHIENK